VVRFVDGRIDSDRVQVATGPAEAQTR
jgi:hypothetical protein